MPEDELLLAVCIANFLNQADRAIMPLAIPEMASEYGWEMGTQGWVLSSFACGYILTNLAGGILAFLFGGERILLFAVGVWSLCTLFTPIIAGMPVQCLIAVRVVLGLSEGMGSPSIIHMLSQSLSGK